MIKKSEFHQLITTILFMIPVYVYVYVDHCVFQCEVMYMCLYMCICRCCWSLRGRPLRKMLSWLSVCLNWVLRARCEPSISLSHLTCARSAWITVKQKVHAHTLRVINVQLFEVLHVVSGMLSLSFLCVYFSDAQNQPLHLITSSDKHGSDLLKVEYIKVSMSISLIKHSIKDSLKWVVLAKWFDLCWSAWPFCVLQADVNGPSFNTLFNNTEQTLKVCFSFTVPNN